MGKSSSLLQVDLSTTGWERAFNNVMPFGLIQYLGFVQAFLFSEGAFDVGYRIHDRMRKEECRSRRCSLESPKQPDGIGV
jgi:hypothetical protein